MVRTTAGAWQTFRRLDHMYIYVYDVIYMYVCMQHKNVSSDICNEKIPIM